MASYDPNWEERAEHAKAEFDALYERSKANEDAPVDYQDNLQERCKHLESDIKVLDAWNKFISALNARFRTVEEYRDFYLRSFWKGIGAGQSGRPKMPDGLTIREIERRLKMARDYAETASPTLFLDGTKEEREQGLREILEAPPDATVSGVVALLRASGGDHA